MVVDSAEFTEIPLDSSTSETQVNESASQRESAGSSENDPKKETSDKAEVNTEEESTEHAEPFAESRRESEDITASKDDAKPTSDEEAKDSTSSDSPGKLKESTDETHGTTDSSQKESTEADTTNSSSKNTKETEAAESEDGKDEDASLSSQKSTYDARDSGRSTPVRVSAKHSRNASIRRSHINVEAQPVKLFIKNAFEKIKTSKDAKRIPALQTATEWVLDQLEKRPDVLPPVKSVLEPLRLICVPPGSSNELKEVAIDTLGQLFSLNYLEIVEDDTEQSQLLADAVNIVCDSWEAEGADQRVEVQIIKALTAAVVNEDVVVHGSVLMRAVRHVYHIFVITRSQANQNLAQVSLTQLVQAVFERVKSKSSLDYRLNHRTSTETSVTLEENSEQSGNPPSETMATLTLQEIQNTPLPDLEDVKELRSELENTIQDAGLLFRTLCRLSMKVIDETDVKSQQMRSKLLSLHLIHMILKHNVSVFKNKRVIVRKTRNESEPLAYAVKPYLRQTIAQNALSQVPAVFEITSEIFWLILSNLRSEFKPEIAVFFTDVYYTAMDLRTATIHQKLYFMTILSRMCTDPRMLVELYLNYDCESNSPNLFEKMMDLVSRLALKPAVEPATPLTRMSIDRQQIKVYDLNSPPQVAISRLTSGSSVTPSTDEHDAFMLKMAAVDSMVNVLNSLILWSQRADSNGTVTDGTESNRKSRSPSKTDVASTSGSSEDSSHKRNMSSSTSLGSFDTDDPDQFANRKKNKRVMDAAIQEFNFNASRGIAKMAEAGLISDPKDPKEVAKFLLSAEGLDKAKLGDYLGKNSEFNLEVMAQFVSAMDLKGLSLPEALRRCLQRFRLPGEGQVVDRYMHTIAGKYFDDNSTDGIHPDFASSDATWVLATSIMMLNTDLHASAIRRRRMTSDEFVANNRGMNDGEDFREDLLRQCYTEIQQNEIKLESEQQEHAIRDKTYDVASDVITSRAAQLFKSSPLDASDYYNASHAAHIRPMFELSWLAVLAGLSNPFSQLKDPLALASCLKGLELALGIACSVDVELARISFVQTLAQSTMLTYPDHMQWKNVGALRALLNVTLIEGDSLRESWYDVLVVISQLEQLQLLIRSNHGASTYNTDKHGNIVGPKLPPREIAETLLSREFVVDIDRIFTNTQSMTNAGAVDFVKALSRVSLEDISNSRQQREIRFFALQKMVDVCYYNSARIRMGWSELWDAAMAEQFAKVLVDKNNQVVMFALDSLRQLSMRFLDIDELPHFAFQHEFLQPFSHALRHNSNPEIKVLVLECLTQLVMTRASKLKSGWAAIFNAVKAASESNNVAVVEAAYKLLKTVPIEEGVPEGFLEACSAIAEQSEAKNALRAVAILKRLVETNLDDMSMLQKIFVALSSIAMTGSDPEVRGECLQVLFGLLNKYGERFTRDDWNVVFTNSLSPLFSRLHDHNYRGKQIRTPGRSPSRSPVRHGEGTPTRAGFSPSGQPTRGRHLQVPSHFDVAASPERNHITSSREDWTLWLSTTLMQALKSIIDLFNTYFDKLEHALDPFFLELLRKCILQNDDPVTRKGIYCLEFLIESNANRFTEEHWHLVVSKIVQLFKDTTASTLMDRSIIDDPTIVDAAGVFRAIIPKTVQALLIISSIRDMLVGSQKIFDAMPIKEILRITTRLRMSYEFAHEFNSQHDLRQALYERGFVRHTPNLLYQESSAAQTYISVSMRLFKATNRFSTDPSARQDVSEELMQHCNGVMHNYNSLHQHSDQRHIEKLLPIVKSILQHVNEFEDSDFKQLVPTIYLQVIDILNKDMPQDLQEEVQRTLRKAAHVWILNNTEESTQN